VCTAAAGMANQIKFVYPLLRLTQTISNVGIVLNSSVERKKENICVPSSCFQIQILDGTNSSLETFCELEATSLLVPLRIKG
jgi:hypothetical protein